MPDCRSGGPVGFSFEHGAAGLVLRIEDLACGGGMTLHFPSPAWAQLWLDDLGRQLNELEHDEVFGR